MIIHINEPVKVGVIFGSGSNIKLQLIVTAVIVSLALKMVCTKLR